MHFWIRGSKSCTLHIKCWWNQPQESISPTFHEQLLLKKIPKAQKAVKSPVSFALFGSTCSKGACKTLVKLTPMTNPIKLFFTANKEFFHVLLLPMSSNYKWFFICNKQNGKQRKKCFRARISYRGQFHQHFLSIFLTVFFFQKLQTINTENFINILYEKLLLKCCCEFDTRHRVK